MKLRHLTALLILAGAGIFSVQFAPARGAQENALMRREALYRRNNLGVAYLEQYKHEEAAREFRGALAADPSFALARINLALALYFLNDSRGAAQEAREALKLAPTSPHAHYVLGAALKKEKLYDEALVSFNRIVASDPREPVTNIQIGQIHSAQGKYPEAIEAFHRALAAEPYNATAAYSLAQAQLRAGQAQEGRQTLALFQKLRSSGYATTLGLNYGEQGRYAEAVTSTGAEPELTSKEAPAARYIEATPAALKLSAPTCGAALGRRLTKTEFDDANVRRDLIAACGAIPSAGDYDGDQRIDLFVTGADAAGRPVGRLLRNEGGRFTDATEASRITVNGAPSGALFGDFDNDDKTDLLIFGYQTLALWRNQGDGTFSDLTAKAGLPANYPAWALSAAWVDADHDGDLDLFAGNFADLSQWPGGESAIFPDDFPGQANRLFRNNGNGTFTDVSTETGLGGGKTRTTAVVATDFNNLRDIDLLVVNYGAPPQLFSNQRDGTFRELAASVGLSGAERSLGVGAGDLNKDGFTDFYFPQAGGADALFLSDGRGAFAKQEAPGSSLGAQVVDYDNDGLLDVVSLGREGLQLRRGLGGRLEAPAPASSLKLAAARSFAVADFDRDGAPDLIAVKDDGAIALLRAEGVKGNYARLALAGKTSNRSAIGTKIELRSGSLSQKLEVYAASPAPAATGITFGLGARTQVDALRLFWPAGILQSELAIRTGGDNAIAELDRKGTSCPLLYAWNGSEFGFVTDFLGGSAFGYLTAPGQYNYPDTDEYVRITGEQLQERDGVYSLRLNNQLEEVIFFDRVRLLAVDHPASTEIYPNERLLPAPPYPDFKLYSVSEARPPVAATDDRGRDVLNLISQVDRRWPEDFELLPFKGYAREHALELDLGAIKGARRVLLLLTAWIDYADSTSNLAAAQAGARLIPPYVQVKNAAGEWQTAVPQMGFPAGLPKTMTLDLTGKFLCDDARIRIVTSMRIYWDQILIDTSSGAFATRLTRLEPTRGELRWRGFPREYSPDGRAPRLYDYRVIDEVAPWKAHRGHYTRYGDVRELLLETDDMYVITRNGDELAVDFDARALPPLPAGWRRDFLLYADGFGKDMDINSARPGTVGELPFHRMKSYPYAPGESYPDTPRHRAYQEKYNTRQVGREDQAAWRGVR